MSARKGLALPMAWYSTVPELCHEWGCHPDRLYYYMDSGQLVPSVLIGKERLPPGSQAGTAPHVCVVLDEFRSVEWLHVDGTAQAWLAGEYPAFYVDADGFKVLQVVIDEPVPFTRCDLVVIDSNREAFMELFVPTASRRPNKSKERATALVMRGLLQKAFPEDLERPYAIAAQLVGALSAMGASLSKETIAGKIRESLAVSAQAVKSNVETVT